MSLYYGYWYKDPEDWEAWDSYHGGYTCSDIPGPQQYTRYFTGSSSNTTHTTNYPDLTLQMLTDENFGDKGFQIEVRAVKDAELQFGGQLG